MSQASRYKALAPVRIREQVARELARLRPVPEHLSGGVVEAGLLSGRRLNLLAGGHFNVHAAREHARSLVALEAEQTAFEDWTRALGKGPEDPERSFGSDLAPGGFCTGWPGKLARQWGGDSRAPMGRSLARLGRHILAALEGQPSECQAAPCVGRRVLSTHGVEGEVFVFEGVWDLAPNCHIEALADTGIVRVIEQCPDCQGTGHNLRGVLGPVEWSPAVRRKAADSYLASERDPDRGGRSWMAIHVGAVTYGRSAPRREDFTVESGGLRVTARGEHRNGMAHQFGPLYFSDAPLDVKIESRGWRSDLESGGDPWGDPWMHRDDRMPGWRLGELKHAEQRRVKAARAFGDDVRRSVAVLQRGAQ